MFCGEDFHSEKMLSVQDALRFLQQAWWFGYANLEAAANQPKAVEMTYRNNKTLKEKR